MHKVLAVAFSLSLLSFPAYSAEKPQKIKRMDNLLAVFDFDVQCGIDKSIARSLAESVRIELVNSGKYEVIDRSNMNKILKEQAFQMTGCVAKECAVEAGQMLGVGKIVVGTVGLIGKTYYLTLSLVNVETGKTELIKDNEWIFDWYDNGYYKVSPKNNPSGPQIGTEKVMRGGYYNSGPNPDELLITLRDKQIPRNKDGRTGFRLVLPVK